MLFNKFTAFHRKLREHGILRNAPKAEFPWVTFDLNAGPIEIVEPTSTFENTRKMLRLLEACRLDELDAVLQLGFVPEDLELFLARKKKHLYAHRTYHNNEATETVRSVAGPDFRYMDDICQIYGFEPEIHLDTEGI